MMPDDKFRFHHFGLAARDVVRAMEFVRFAGYDCSESVHDPLQAVNLRWCTKRDAPAIEIVSPLEGSGPLSNILATRDSSFYHLCYEIDSDTDSALGAMRQSGLRVVTVSTAKPAVLFQGRHVSFHTVAGFGLVELLESTVRSGIA